MSRGVEPKPRRARSALQLAKDFCAFPLRAVAVFYEDRWGLSSLATERFDYVAGRVRGRCLDVGCGAHNRFVTAFLGGNGCGVDVYPWEGLSETQVVRDLTHFPFPDGSFDTVTFIANINHVPKGLRDAELAEAARVLKSGGNIIVTMGNPVAEILVHKLVALYDALLGTRVDVDGERGMEEDEEYYLLDGEIIARLKKAGFVNCRRKHFWTQWGLNHLLEADKA